MLAESLLEILRCPKSKEPLVYFPRGEDGETDEAAFLFCPASGLRYRVESGVPVLLVEEASTVDPKAGQTLLQRAQTLGLRVPT